MRRIYLLLLTGIMFAATANGQVANYSFAASSGTYTPISGGTVIGTGAWDDASVTTSVPLGFTFTFNGVPYTTCNISYNGFMTLGGTTPANGLYNPISATTGYSAAIAAWGRDMQGQSSAPAGDVQYLSSGGIFTVQWTNARRYNGSTANTERFEMQIQLIQSGNLIKFVYGAWSDAQSNASGDATVGEVGLRGAANTDFKNIGVLSTGNWATPTTTGTTNASTVYYNQATVAVKPASGQTYTFTPPPPCTAPSAQPTSLILTPTVSTIAGSFTAASPVPSGYLVVRTLTNVQPAPVDGTTYTVGSNPIGYIESVGVGTTFTSTGLTGGTQYYYWVFSYNNTVCSGGPAYLTVAPLTNSATTTACSIGGVIPVGPGETYTSLKAAVDAVVLNGVTGPVILELNAAYTSGTDITFPIVLGTVPCASSTNTITIRPAAGAGAKTITSANTIATFDINGGNYWIIDGQQGGTGGVKDLSIANTSTATGGTAIRFINEASNNIVKYVTLTTVFNNTSGGVVIFSTTTGANGNDNNTINNCNIDGGAGANASPAVNTSSNNGIYSLGTTATTAQNNSGNVISNNNIFNFFVSGAASNGLNILGGNTDWSITGNSFYQTNTRTITVGAQSTGILISNSTSGNNFVITGNYIGGSAASAAGVWTLNGAFATRFVGIQLSLGTTTASSVQGNTVTNITQSSTSGATTLPGVFGGIYISAGNANIGTTSANTVGSGTGTGSISITSSTTGAVSMGIGSASSGTVAISNNVIGSITTFGSTASIAHGFNGIWTTGGTTVTINNNTIGSTATPSSINAGTAGTVTAAQVVTGILNSGSATLAITNNTIANLNNAAIPTTASSLSVVRGIVSSSGTNTITGNTIRNLSTAANVTGTGSTASVIGISLTSATAGTTVGQNTLHTLSNTHASAAVSVTGIYYSGATSGTNVVARNFIHSLAVSSTSATANITGIYIGGGVANYQNNMIRLGIDAAGASLTNNIIIAGIDKQTTSNNNIYFNSVYIGGTGVLASTANTFAFRRASTGTDILENNIFYNARSNAAGTAKHYAAGLNTITTLTIDYNDYFVNGTGGNVGYIGTPGTTDYATFALFKAATVQDANSLNVDPLFIDAIGATPNLHITSGTTTLESAALAIGGITNDFDNDTRPGAPSGSNSGVGSDIGADEFNGINPSLCAGTPASAGTATASFAVVCAGANVTLTLTGATSGPGISYQWQSSPAGAGTWTNITGATSTSSVVAVTGNTDFRAVVKCATSGLSANSNTVTVNGNCQFDVTRTTGVTYTSISGTGTGVSSWNITGSDDAVSNLVNIGFSFAYKGINYTQLSVGTNGNLTLGAVGSSAFNNNLNGFNNVLAPFWDDLLVQGNPGTAGNQNFIKTQLDGSAPNRIFTVEWIGMEQFNYGGPNMNFQVKLYENNGNIEFIYGTMDVFNGTAPTSAGQTYPTLISYSIGLSGQSGLTGLEKTLSQLSENAIAFNSTDPLTLAISPTCNTKYTFTAGGPYTGSTTAVPAAAPSNDNSAGAITVAVNPTPCTTFCGTTYTTKNATASPETSSCGTAPDDDVWFKFTATTSVQTITVRGAVGFDAVVSLLNASFVEVAPFGCVDATTGVTPQWGQTETINATGLTPGNIYYVRVSHKGTGSGSPTGFSICVNEIVPPPSNDDPCGAYALTVNSTCIPYSDNSLPSKTSFLTATTTTSNGVIAPACSGAGTVNDVWFSFVAPASGSANITVTPVSGVNPALELFGITSGTCGGANLVLAPLGCLNSVGSGAAEAATASTLTPGATYYLRVYQHPSGTGGTPVSNSQFSICIFANCPIPTTVAVGSITQTSASVSFNGGAGTSFIVEYGLSGFTPGVAGTAGPGGTVVTGGASPIAISGLTTATTYDVYVRQDCGAGSYSPNTALVTFSTLCNNYPLPVSEGFNTAGTSTFPTCWTQQFVVGTSNISFQTASSSPTTAPFEGTRFAFWNSFSSGWPAGNETRLVSPPITTTGTASVDVDFAWMNDNNDSYDDLNYLNEGVQVQYSLDGTTWINAGAFIPRHDPTLTLGTNQWKLQNVVLPAGAGNQATIFIGFKFHSEFGDNCALDSVVIHTSPLCTQPSAVTIGSITETTASVSFTSGGTSFIVEYGAPGFIPGTLGTAGAGTIVTGASSPISLTGLTASTTYDVYVRQVCAGPIYSTNSTLKQFTTQCAAATIPYTMPISAVTPPALPTCTSVENTNADVTTWSSYSSGDLGVPGWTYPVMAYIYNPDFTTPANDWLFTQGLNLTAGTHYTLTFKYNNDGTTTADAPDYWFEKLKVKYGTAPNAGAMTLLLQDFPLVTSATPLTATIDFVPASTGVYYIGFQAYSDANKDVLILDDIVVTLSPSCILPSNVAVTATGANSASVSFVSAGTNFIVEYGATGFTPGTGTTAGAGGTVVTGAASPIALTGMTGGPAYDVYVRQVCAGPNYSYNTTVVAFFANDEAAGAKTLTLGAGCTGATETNVGATKSANEVYPNCSGVAQTPVWYKFVAPASGAVRISTDVGTAGGFNDSKIAIFSAENVNDYSTFNVISCDDDGGSSPGLGFMSVVYATGLTPGTTYYVAVDRYDEDIPTGTFCIAFDELNNSMIATTASCAAGQTPIANSVTNYIGWVPLVDAASKLVALVRNPAGGSPSDYSFSQNINGAVVRTDPTSGEKYLDRNYLVTNSVATNVDVQLFFLTSELTALAAVDPAATLANLRVTKQTGITCQSSFVTANGTNSELVQAGSATSADGLVKWIQVNTPSFSNFFIHSTRAPLIVKTFLQGAYSAGLARHKDVTPAWAAILNANALNQPYNTAAFGNYNGGESVTAGFFTSDGTNARDITDWVLLEVKNASSVTVARRAAFVREDGKIVDINGDTLITFNGLGTGNFYLTVRHRNHLGMSVQNLLPVTAKALGVPPPTSTYDFDFTNATDANIFGDALAYKVVGGNNLMICGNANSNTNIRYGGSGNDPAAVLVFLGGIPTGIVLNVYTPSDVNMDGTVRYGGSGNDPGFLLANALGGIPTAIVNEQKR